MAYGSLEREYDRLNYGDAIQPLAKEVLRKPGKRRCGIESSILTRPSITEQLCPRGKSLFFALNWLFAGEHEFGNSNIAWGPLSG